LEAWSGEGEWRSRAFESTLAIGALIDDNWVMTSTPMTNVPIPSDLAKELEAQAKKAGMTLPVYVAFLARVGARQHDDDFRLAAKHLFSSYPKTLRKLAE